MTKSDWFKDVVVYQIYTRSFFDSNGDGVGDIAGVTAKLDYIEKLGVDVIWISPFCSSPNYDNGYDVSDYRDVMKEFGFMDDIELLIEECHKRNIKVMMDLVLNHSSDEHPWFIEARSSKDSPKRDYYIWSKEPNNWESYFEDSAWTFDESSEEYYLHHFYYKQPDLNWSNPKLREEMYEIVQWWIDKGIDAFRLDAIHHIGKPEGLPDALEPEKRWSKRNYRNTEETHQYLQELYEKVLINHDVMTVGETGGTTPESSRLYVDQDRNELDMVFHFGHVLTKKLDAPILRDYFKKWYDSLSPKGWDTVFFSNHDLPRHVSVFGDDQDYRKESAKLFATLELTMWGTPYLYQGEEIGMTNVRFDDIDDYQDQASKKRYEWALKSGKSEEKALEYFLQRNRDNARTPMQWNSQEHGGFTTGEPWIKVNPNYKSINVEEENQEADSILNYYKELIALHKDNNALKRGDFKLYGEEDSHILAYTRTDEEREFLILLNISGDSVEYRIDEINQDWNLVIGNYVKQPESLSQNNLFKPWEARVYMINK
ncbi:oligo-1,6-glucosidase [Orenia metallireducens]|jgi:oligo-1,6-glucosidase|uniref:glycoside hydrolase family 13 protein n=1 Tax=Orenia metallireducens TaxID=1413210 RepID=UPI000D065276|nr:alpha-glucosidase [Orenia metallireducens]PRX26895.1 oligo-1,6-glucosidase [Orenia metallireducens]